jgi:hypothetical protein
MIRNGENMKGFAIMRVGKCQSAGTAGAIEKHHEREKEEYPSNPDIDRSRSDLNYHIVEPEAGYKEVIEERIKEAKEANPALLERANSVHMVDVLFTASPLFFEYDEEWEHQKYFEAAMQFARDWAGERNIISAVVHMDERTPHMHLTFVPITKDNRLCAKDFTGGRKDMSKLQDKFYEAISRELPGFLRGRSKNLTGRERLPTQTLKAMHEMGYSDKQYAQMMELKALRKLAKQITPEMMEQIKENGRAKKKRQQEQDRNRTR